MYLNLPKRPENIFAMSAHEKLRNWWLSVADLKYRKFTHPRCGPRTKTWTWSTTARFRTSAEETYFKHAWTRACAHVRWAHAFWFVLFKSIFGVFAASSLGSGLAFIPMLFFSVLVTDYVALSLSTKLLNFIFQIKRSFIVYLCIDPQTNSVFTMNIHIWNPDCVQNVAIWIYAHTKRHGLRRLI